MLEQYFPILLFILFAALISCVMIALPMLIARFSPSVAKASRYECGFDPISSPRDRFEVRFYLVAILFILFDLEIAFLFPWAVALGEIGDLGFFSMLSFLAMLTVGFVYEWKKGALQWN